MVLACSPELGYRPATWCSTGLNHYWVARPGNSPSKTTADLFLHLAASTRRYICQHPPPITSSSWPYPHPRLHMPPAMDQTPTAFIWLVTTCMYQKICNYPIRATVILACIASVQRISFFSLHLTACLWYGPSKQQGRDPKKYHIGGSRRSGSSQLLGYLPWLWRASSIGRTYGGSSIYYVCLVAAYGEWISV